MNCATPMAIAVLLNFDILSPWLKSLRYACIRIDRTDSLSPTLVLPDKLAARLRSEAILVQRGKLRFQSSVAALRTTAHDNASTLTTNAPLD
jgi:hypothetical protein